MRWFPADEALRDAKRLGIPNSALLGSMIAAGTLNIFGCFPQFSTWLISFVSNVLIGAMIGRQIDRAVLGRVTNISLTTALLSGTAGGLTEMPIFGLSPDANVSVIALVQVLRVVVFTALIPCISLLGRKSDAFSPGAGLKPSFPCPSSGPVNACS